MQSAQNLSAAARRDKLRVAVARHLPASISQAEINAHFMLMPVRYWENVDVDDAVFHLRSIHTFFKGLQAAQKAATAPLVRWKHFPDGRYTEVIVITWDRQGLLARIAGSFSSALLLIRNANAYTRTDHVVLDIFQVSDIQQRHVHDEALLRKTVRLLTSDLSGPAAVAYLPIIQAAWQQAPATMQSSGKKRPSLITWNNDVSEDYTALRVETDDRPSLLYHILHELSEWGLNINMARVSTENSRAIDEFDVSQHGSGGKIVGEQLLARIRQSLLRKFQDLESVGILLTRE